MDSRPRTSFQSRFSETHPHQKGNCPGGSLREFKADFFGYESACLKMIVENTPETDWKLLGSFEMFDVHGKPYLKK